LGKLSDTVETLEQNKLNKKSKKRKKMQILWKFHYNHHVWLEWIQDGKMRMKRFTEEAFEAFMSKDDELDFLD